MIRVARTSTKPEILLTKGAKQTEQDKAAYDIDPDGYRPGNQEFQRNIYGHNSVKQALLDAQHSKCCYCEAKIGATSYGEVEHYRPKGAVKQSSESTKEYPGYYWLAYDWDNLLVSCSVCNRKKSVLFSLVDETTRARNHHDDIEKEQPLFINPARVDPRRHIRFHREAPIGKTEQGQVTIECLKLRRNALQECRRSLLNNLIHLHKVVVIGENYDNPDMQKLVQEAREQLELAASPQSQFSSMALDFLNSTASVQRQTPGW